MLIIKDYRWNRWSATRHVIWQVTEMEVKEWWLDAWGRRCWACSRYVCRHEQLHLPVCMDPVGARRVLVLLQVHTTYTVKEQSDERLKANDFFFNAS